MNDHIAPDLGGLWLGQLPPHIIACVVEFVRENGIAAGPQAQRMHAEMIGGQPLLNFIPPVGNVEVHANIAMGLQCVMKDAQIADWSLDKYAEMIKRTAGVSDTYARKLADRVFTPDGGAIDFAHRFLNWLPDIPLTTIDDHAKGSVHSLIDMISRALPSALNGKSEDNLYEFMLLGEQLRALRMRAVLKASGERFAGVNTAPPTGADGKPDFGKLKDIAATILPVAIRVLGTGAAALGGGGALPALGSGATPLLLGAGDLDEGGDEQGDLAVANHLRRAADATRSVLSRAASSPLDGDGQSLYAAMRQLAEYMRPMDSETGDLIDTILDVASVAAPVAGSAFGPLGTMAGGVVGAGLGLLNNFVGEKRGGGAQPGRAAPAPSPANASAASAPSVAQLTDVRNRLAALERSLKSHVTTNAKQFKALNAVVRRGGSVNAAMAALGARPAFMHAGVPLLTAVPRPDDVQFGLAQEVDNGADLGED